MQRNRFSTDGFVVRRHAQQGADRPRPTLDSSPSAVPSQYLIDPTKARPQQAGKAPMLRRSTNQGTLPLGATKGNELTLPKPTTRQERINIDLSLDDEPGQQDKRGKRGRRGGVGKKKWGFKRIAKWSSIALLVVVIGVAGYFGWKLLSTSSKIFKGNPIAAIFSQAQPLKKDANGNTNILLFGTSEDDPGHPGGDLTDSIMVASINQDRKDGFLVSIPRDLHVSYGQACVSGYQGKVNVVYSCAKDKSGEDAGAAALRNAVGAVTGLDFQYSVHLNYTVLRQAVDAVGGITVNITSDDPRGILDRNFDWDCPKGPQTCYNVKYPVGPANLDGKHALYLARARGDDPLGRTYGLSRSNPDREDNQRKILIALKDKAVSAGVLTNPVAVNNLLDALGNNLRTNFDASEIKTLLQLGKDVKSESITSFSLEDPDKPLATASCFSGDICPNKGPTDYSAIQAAINSLATNDKASLEGAVVDVLNATGPAGSAQAEANVLAAKNITVGQVGNAPAALGTKPYVLYDLSGGKKPATLKKLQDLLGVTATSGTPAGVNSSASFVVVIGAGPDQNNQ